MAQEATKQKDWMTLCDWIDDGMLDNGLDELARAINGRKDVVARRMGRRKARELKVGDKVMLTNKVQPRWLEGVTGHVISLRDGAAEVRLDSIPSHRGRPPIDGHKDRVVVPFAHIEKLDENTQTLSMLGGAENIGDDQEEDDDELEVDEDEEDEDDD